MKLSLRVLEMKLFGKGVKAKKRRSNTRGKRPALSKTKALFWPIIKIAFTVVVVSALTFGGWRLYLEVTSTTRLEVSVIEIEGGSTVLYKDVLNLSGIERGINILKIDVKAAEVLIKTHPFIEDVVVKRVLPDTIRIELSERVPVALVSADKLYAMDVNGVLFKEYSFADGLDLPVITGPDKGGDEWVEEIKPRVLELLTILDEGTTRLKLAELSEIHGDPYYGLTLVTLNDGVKIDIGNEDFREKLAKLDKVLEIRKGLSSGIESIYLNSDRGVVVRSMPSSLKGERGVS